MISRKFYKTFSSSLMWQQNKLDFLSQQDFFEGGLKFASISRSPRFSHGQLFYEPGKKLAVKNTLAFLPEFQGQKRKDF